MVVICVKSYIKTRAGNFTECAKTKLSSTMPVSILKWTLCLASLWSYCLFQQCPAQNHPWQQRQLLCVLFSRFNDTQVQHTSKYHCGSAKSCWSLGVAQPIEANTQETLNLVVGRWWEGMQTQISVEGGPHHFQLTLCVSGNQMVSDQQFIGFFRSF